MDKYINKINFDFQTNQKILNLISQIDLYKGKYSIPFSIEEFKSGIYYIVLESEIEKRSVKVIQLK